MPPSTATVTVVFGGWYQRTTLHLTEVFDFFAFSRAHPQLDQAQLDQLHSQLNLSTSTREAEYLEFVHATTTDGIDIRYYEDGLYILQVTTPNVSQAETLLHNYFLTKFEPAISYIFSLGAPIPKVLANLKVNHPLVVCVHGGNKSNFEVSEQLFGQVYSKITSGNITVYKTPKYIIITSPDANTPMVDITQMQIFFREFKDQLAKYLDIHRTIWEAISQIKERGTIRGSEISPLRSKLDSYQKTVSLIANRINQMGTYIHTRKALAKELNIEIHLKTLFQYKFETLENTLGYIKEIWSMTREYLSSAIGVLDSLESQAATNSIKSLQIITSVGVVATLVTYFTRSDLPRITSAGLTYFAILVLATLILNLGISRFYRNLQYHLKFPKHTPTI